MTSTVNVISLGAGVQSSAMLLMYLEGDLTPMPDYAIFADTQAEPDKVYHWLEYLKGRCRDRIPLLVTSKGHIIEDAMYGDRPASIPFFVKNEDGSQGMIRRQCTTEYKIKAVYKEIREQLGYKFRQRMKHDINLLIGISIDEAHRMKDNPHKWATNCYPLVDKGLSRTDCWEYVKKLTSIEPPKSACYICPYRNNDSWRHLKKTEPEAFAKAVEFEKWMQSTPRFKGCAFIHRSMVPLDEIDFDKLEPNPPLFGEECEGMCGV